MFLHLRKTSLALASAVLLGAMPLAAQQEHDVEVQPVLALMGTIPIYWGEADGFAELLDSADHAHWARAVIEQDFTLKPLDFLSAEALSGQRFLLLAQPRALAAEENVALDEWVRAGGRLLLFVDPMMTGDSRFGLGDRRRPQDVALLSPILARWGLELQFDEQQAPGLHMLDHFGDALPVNLPGRLEVLPGHQECSIPMEEALLAHCVVGQGQVLVVADAAMLDIAGPYPSSEQAVSMLALHIFGDFGENAGSTVQAPAQHVGTHGNPPISHHGDAHGMEH